MVSQSNHPGTHFRLKLFRLSFVFENKMENASFMWLSKSTRLVWLYCVSFRTHCTPRSPCGCPLYNPRTGTAIHNEGRGGVLHSLYSKTARMIQWNIPRPQRRGGKALPRENQECFLHCTTRLSGWCNETSRWLGGVVVGHLPRDYLEWFVCFTARLPGWYSEICRGLGSVVVRLCLERTWSASFAVQQDCHDDTMKYAVASQEWW